ncbi:MAG: M20 family metallopeptidase, partial [Spirochaetota bacterium]
MRGAELLAIAREMQPWLVETRRRIHANPELGREELETAAFIEERLDEMGVAHSRVATGVIAQLDGSSPGPTIAIRADIDALPVEEQNELDYRSRKPGLMHACGHDAHTTVALGVAKLFSTRRGTLAGSLRFLFQPDEEGDGGAEPLIAAGALDNPPVDAILGLHVMPYLDPGEIEIKKGALNGSSCTLTIVVRGKGAHGAYPDLGIDAIAISASVVQALNQLVSRYVSPMDEAVITIGTINGGQRSNILAEEVRMMATLRTTSDVVRDRLIGRARAIVEGIPASFGGAGSLEVRYGYRALVNHDAEVDAVVRVAGELLGTGAVHWKEKPSMGVEDFSFYLNRVPGAFW